MSHEPEFLPPLPEAGRRFATSRVVRLGDVTRSGRLRLDALACYLQDIASDDVADGGLHEPAWVVRRTLVRVERFPRYQEPVKLTTFCWSMGSRFAERRTSLKGPEGSLDTLTLWVRLDPETGRPTALSDDFRALYAVAVGSRRTQHRLRHEDLPPDTTGPHPWPLRGCDFDVHRHVNNAVYWTAVEDRIAELAELADPYDPNAPLSCEMEFRTPIAEDVDIGIRTRQEDGALRLWFTDGSKAYASAVIWPTYQTGFG